ncbi:MAG: cyclopropane fatty acyl phospholipid synthase [Gemmatimonadota bacterium]|nr:MAG: cyclopropane fatty acyl phospholipid synthase [Gemmatimonadota bacterium]
MARDSLRRRVEELLAHADVEVGGSRPWDIRVHDARLYARVMAQGSLGLGESYMDGWWDCDRLDELFYRIVRAGLEYEVRPLADGLRALRARVINLQSPSRAFQIGRRHYDIGNDLYRCMLDRRMIYSCGYWKDAMTLDEAQEAKLDLVCRKLGLRPGMRVLDIGCGWGGAAKFAAEGFDVEVVGITVSEEQVRLARDSCEGLPIQIRLQDYREVTDEFDRVFSLGMFEHVGCKNYSAFMRVARRCLRDDGLFLLHTIGGNRSVSTNDPWMARYIFPNSMLPSTKQIADACEGEFVIEDWHNLGPDYDKTLMEWYRNFEGGWDTLKESYNERFRRMWTYYLLSCAGAFRGRKTQLWQIVLSPRGVSGGYLAPR